MGLAGKKYWEEMPAKTRRFGVWKGHVTFVDKSCNTTPTGLCVDTLCKEIARKKIRQTEIHKHKNTSPTLTKRVDIEAKKQEVNIK